MAQTIIQVPSIILPQIWVTGNETELIDDLVTHPSIDIPVEYLQEKTVEITATEIVIAGVPGNLLCWIELSPVPFATSDAYYSAIGGGGGPLDPATGLPYIAPVAPLTEVALGIVGAPPTFASTVHSITLPWAIHSVFARLVIQTPVAAALPNAFWAVQAVITAKTP